MKPKRLTPTDVQVGQSIRAHRLIARMSQAELGEKIGVSFQQVQKYEKGVNRVGAGRLHQIAGIFKVPISTLFEPQADISRGKPGVSAAPVKFLSDQSAVRLLASYSDITDRGVRRGVFQLVDLIAKAARKQRKQGRGATDRPE
jgi:transcriptional regulator with XRE-family HTH domain